jgi:hypothetical protein
LGDLVDCPLHGPNPIIEIISRMPSTDGLPTAHQSAKAKCGAEILVSVFQGPGAGGGAATVGEEVAMETEDMSDDEHDAYVTSRFGGGTGGAGIAAGFSRAGGGGGSATGEEITGPDVSSTNLGCDGITNDTPDNAKISAFYTVSSFSSRAGLPHTIPATTAKGLTRSTVICNLKHLATNSIDKAKTYIEGKGYTVQVGSGFRDATNGSDHNIGSAADLWVFHNGARVSRQTLRELALGLINDAKIPFTQMLLEFTPSSQGWIHVANRRLGGNSGLRIGFTLSGGAPYSSGLPVFA